MAFVDKLIEKTTAEWERWGFSKRPVHGQASIGGTEQNSPYIGYVNDYWKVVGEPTWNGKTAQPWSAAFISFCFEKAGAGEGFPYRSGHAAYCAAILKSPQKYPALRLIDPGQAVLARGDIVWAARSGDTCPAPPDDYAEAIAILRKGGWFCSHADIVVSVRGGEVDVIGGNVSNSVTMTSYTTDNGQIRDPRQTWLGVVKNGM